MLDPEPAVGEDATEAPPPPSPAKRPKSGGGSASVLGAAMIAVGEILEPEKTNVEIVQTDDEPLDELPFSLDFGSLPPLD